jgi:hypothetical protein
LQVTIAPSLSLTTITWFPQRQGILMAGHPSEREMQLVEGEELQPDEEALPLGTQRWSTQNSNRKIGETSPQSKSRRSSSIGNRR